MLLCLSSLAANANGISTNKNKNKVKSHNSSTSPISTSKIVKRPWLRESLWLRHRVNNIPIWVDQQTGIGWAWLDQDCIEKSSEKSTTKSTENHSSLEWDRPSVQELIIAESSGRYVFVKSFRRFPIETRDPISKESSLKNWHYFSFSGQSVMLFKKDNLVSSRSLCITMSNPQGIPWTYGMNRY